MNKKKFLQEWKKDWEERKREFLPNQSEIYERIRARKNLEVRLERRMEKILKEMAEGISKEVYPIKEAAV